MRSTSSDASVHQVSPEIDAKILPTCALIRHVSTKPSASIIGPLIPASASLVGRENSARGISMTVPRILAKIMQHAMI